MRKNSKAFTLVELIVVITILAILGTIAFLSFQGYSSDARDSTRTTDLSSIKTSLELFNTKVGGYPLPTSYTGVTYSGGLVWNQGTFGIDPFKQLGNISKVPLDPLTSNEYTYSITNTKGEYEIAVVYEGALVKNKNILNQANAGSVQGNTKIMGSYNGVYVMTNTGGTNFTLFVPTIINGDMSVLDLPSMISGGKIVVMGGTKLPDSYKNSNFKNEDFSTQIGSNIIISTGSLADLKAKNGTALRQEFLDNLKIILSGTTVENNYKELINTTSDTLALNLVSGKWKANIYNGAVANTIPIITPITNCISGQGFDGTSCITATQCTTGLESITLSNGQTWSCKNLGATEVGTGILSYGYYYQRGRDDIGFTNGNSEPPYNYGWEIQNDSKWGGSTGDILTLDGVGTTSIGRQGPCPTGWHVPSIKDWQEACNNILGETCYDGIQDNSLFSLKLKMPNMSDNLYWSSGDNYSYPYSYYWSSSPYNEISYGLMITSPGPYSTSTISLEQGYYRSYGYNVRCIKN